MPPSEVGVRRQQGSVLLMVLVCLLLVGMIMGHMTQQLLLSQKLTDDFLMALFPTNSHVHTGG